MKDKTRQFFIKLNINLKNMPKKENKRLEVQRHSDNTKEE